MKQTGRHRRPTHRGGATAPTCYQSTTDREGGGAIPRPTTPTGSQARPCGRLSILWGWCTRKDMKRQGDTGDRHTGEGRPPRPVTHHYRQGGRGRPVGGSLSLWLSLSSGSNGDHLTGGDHWQGGRGSNTPTDHPDRLTPSQARPCGAALYPLGLMHPKGYEANRRHRHPTQATGSPCSLYHRGAMATTDREILLFFPFLNFRNSRYQLFAALF